MFEKSPTWTRLDGPLEPPSDQSTSQPSPKLAKGKANMPEWENQVENESILSLDIELDGLNTLMQTNGAKEAIDTANERKTRSADSAKMSIWHIIMLLWWGWWQSGSRKHFPRQPRIHDGSKLWTRKCRFYAKTRHGISFPTHHTKRHKTLSTPLDRNLQPDAASGTGGCEPTQYRQLIGSLIYLTITRPNLSHLLSLLSQFMQNRRDVHPDCTKRVLRYVRGMMDFDIIYKSDMII